MKKRLYAILVILAVLTGASGCSNGNEILLSSTVEYTQYDVNAEAAGKIVDVLLTEGSQVKEGDVIAIIDSSLQETVVQQAEAIVRGKEAQLQQLQFGSREEQIDQAEAALASAQAQYNLLTEGASSNEIKAAKETANVAAGNEETARIAYEYAKSKYDEAQSAFNLGQITEDELDEAKFNMDTALSQYNTAIDQHDAAYAQYKMLKNGASSEEKAAALANVEQAQAQLDLLKNGSSEYTIEQAQADLDTANAQLTIAKLQLSRCNIICPAAGVLSIINISKGDMVNAGSYVATVIDVDNLWMNVYIPQTGLKNVALNDTVVLTSPAWPDINFNGTICYISDMAQFTPKNVETHEAKENTVFKIKIEIIDPEHKLKPGMTVDAHIPVKWENDEQ